MAASSCGRPLVVRTYVSSTYAPFLGAYDRLSCVGNKFCLYACLTSVVRSLRQSYDGRTSLHLAAAEGQSEVVAFLLARGADFKVVDRWGVGALQDAIGLDFSY